MDVRPTDSPLVAGLAVIGNILGVLLGVALMGCGATLVYFIGAVMRWW